MFRKKVTDKKLIQLIVDDPQKGLKLLMDTYTGYVNTIVRSRLYSNEEDIEECVADVFIEFYKNYDSVVERQDGWVKAYLATVAHRKAIDKYRRISAKKNLAAGSENVIEVVFADYEHNPEQSTLKEEERQVLLTTIKELGEPDNEMIFRRYFLMQSVSEIAEHFNMKSNTVSKRISRNLESLKERMGKYYE